MLFYKFNTTLGLSRDIQLIFLKCYDYLYIPPVIFTREVFFKLFNFSASESKLLLIDFDITAAPNPSPFGLLDEIRKGTTLKIRIFNPAYTIKHVDSRK